MNTLVKTNNTNLTNLTNKTCICVLKFSLTFEVGDFMVLSMKEVYLSHSNHKKKISKWMETLNEQRRRHRDFKYIPEDSALLVIDMQNYFISDDAHAFIPVGKFILAQIQKLILGYNTLSLPVIFTRYCVEKKDPQDIMDRWWGDVLLCDDPISKLRDELEKVKGTIIKKPGYSAFFKTDLDRILEEKKITQLVITGVMTHLCCETTAREAFQRGFEVYFVIDGTGTYDEEIHTATLFNLSHGFAVPVTTDEILNELMKR
jgi:bifunctional isochorismate lyase/aryl carrier protein